MKHLIIFFLFFLLVSFSIKAQPNTSDTINIEKRMLGANFQINGKNLSLMKMEELCQPFQDAKDELMQAKRNSNPSIILTLVGAGLIGYTAIKWISGDASQWYFGAGGVVLIGATIPLYLGSRNHSINAARIYNYEMKHKAKP